jgi:small conductance mechanosensitive channel
MNWSAIAQMVQERATSVGLQILITRLTQRLATIANVCKTPVPDVTILTFNPFGPVLAVRPYCHNDHYWQVYFDANMVVREVLGDSAFPGPAYPVAVGDSRRAVAQVAG